MIAHDNFESLLRETIGLDSSTVGTSTVYGAVRRRMETFGIADTQQYWDVLHQSGEELQELIDAVVVPETWFFRDPEAFAALSRLITRDWLSNATAGKLRLLSAACCTGEEPYSMAMTLLDAGLLPEQFEIDALDISALALRRARHGSYGSNSFRGEPLLFRDRYFEKFDREYRLRPEVRRIVTFHHRNLLSFELEAGVPLYDVIFCRNVLIYFDRDTQLRVLKTLAGLLTPTGLLFVGPSEAFLAASSGFASANHSMSFAFRKSGVPSTAPAIPSQGSTTIKTARKPRERPRKERPLVMLADPSSTPNDPPSDRLADAKRLADAGQLAEAGELCEAQLKARGPCFEAYYLLGLVRDSLGESESAVQCYRKALYLNPNHHETMVHLALISERSGDKAAAQTLYERARRAAASERP